MLDRINTRLCKIAEILLGITMIGLTLLITVNSFSRYFLNFTFSWTEEVTRYLLFFIVFIGGGVAAHGAGHLSIDMIQTFMSPNVKRAHAVIVNVISAILCVVIAVAGWFMAQQAWRYGQHGSASGLPLFLVYLPMPVGCVMLALGFLEKAQKAGRGDIQSVDFDSFGN